MAVSSAPTREKRRTSSGSPARKRKGRKQPGFLAIWWPLLLGIAVTPFTIHAASIMALAGPRALMTLYPWVLLLKSPAVGLGNATGENLSQLMLYIQFPFYGLLMSLRLRLRSIWIALALTVALHLIAIFLILITNIGRIS